MISMTAAAMMDPEGFGEVDTDRLYIIFGSGGRAMRRRQYEEKIGLDVRFLFA
jgi:hypothetical protein